MNDLANCREFYSLSPPQLKGCSRKIATRWIFYFKGVAVNGRGYNFNAEKKGLLWRVSDAEDKLAKEKQFNANKQKEWETACERTNHEMENARDQIVKLKGEMTKLSDEQEQEHALQASEVLAEEANADCKWLLVRGVPLIANRIVKSDELAKYMFDLGEAAYDSGCKEARYAEKCQEYEFLEFAIVKAVGKLSRKTDGVEMLKKALGDQDPEAGDAGPSHQV
ncbi:hypothetical protein Hanom_Chr16g01428151 [Helianthus anomalus]